jgi:Spondin-like TSP1 domain/Thrombospondin type 1 domain
MQQSLATVAGFLLGGGVLAASKTGQAAVSHGAWGVRILVLLFVLLLVAVKVRRERFLAVQMGSLDSDQILSSLLTTEGVEVIKSANDSQSTCTVMSGDSPSTPVTMPPIFEPMDAHVKDVLAREHADLGIQDGKACVVSLRNFPTTECDELTAKQLYDPNAVSNLVKVASKTQATLTKELQCVVAFKPGASGQALTTYANNNTAYKVAPALTESVPVDCVVSGWSEWSDCSNKCGPGTQTRARKVITQPEHGGMLCPEQLEKKECMNKRCPENCEVSKWGEWSACSKECGGGQRTRTRTVTKPKLYDGDPCPPLVEVSKCNEQPCPQHCEVTDWFPWTQCSATCGPGTQTRARSVLAPALHGGTECPEPLKEEKACEVTPCPVHCEVTAWSDWSTCSATCGPGTQTRSRSVVKEAASGGRACPSPGELTETRPCTERACNDCKVSEWTDWSACTKACGGGGSQTRTRTITAQAEKGGAACPTQLTEERECGKAPCATDCVVSAWSDWSSCSKPCDTGTQTRTRTVASAATNGGAACPALVEQRECNTQACGRDCQLSEWSAWSSCSAECGPGQQTKTRSILAQPANGGVACPPSSQLTEMQLCNDKPCAAKDCVLTQWSEWSACSKTCGGGSQSRTRQVATPAANGGAPCDSNQREERACNTAACAVDCTLTAWTDWSSCSKACGGGSQSRTRQVATPAANGGTPCDSNQREERACNTGGCPVDCAISAWTPWSSCDKACGGGKQVRTRTMTPAANGGRACDPNTSLVEETACNTQACCTIGDWSTWSTCCGDTRTKRTRSVTPAGCAVAEETQTCNTPCVGWSITTLVTYGYPYLTHRFTYPVSLRTVKINRGSYSIPALRKIITNVSGESIQNPMSSTRYLEAFLMLFNENNNKLGELYPKGTGTADDTNKQPTLDYLFTTWTFSSGSTPSRFDSVSYMAFGVVLRAPGRATGLPIGNDPFRVSNGDALNGFKITYSL